jgi:hypothetical protein
MSDSSQATTLPTSEPVYITTIQEFSEVVRPGDTVWHGKYKFVKAKDGKWYIVNPEAAFDDQIIGILIGLDPGFTVPETPKSR